MKLGSTAGEQTEYRIRLDGGPDVAMRRQNRGLNGANASVAPGAFVYVSWTPEVSLVLPRTTK